MSLHVRCSKGSEITREHARSRSGENGRNYSARSAPRVGSQLESEHPNTHYQRSTDWVPSLPRGFTRRVTWGEGRRGTFRTGTLTWRSNRVHLQLWKTTKGVPPSIRLPKRHIGRGEELHRTDLWHLAARMACGSR